MIKISSNEEKNLDFHFELSGLSPRQIDMRLRMIIDGIEYGFPAELRQESIHVSIPPLKSIVNREFREGETFNASLDVTGDGHFLQPWADHFKVSNPIRMEAKVNEGKKESKPDIRVAISEKPTSEPGDETDMRTLVERTVKRAMTNSKKSIRESKSKPVKRSGGTSSKKQITKETFMQMKKEDVIAYIGRRATKDPRIQEIVYEQAVQAAQSSKPYKVFGKVMEIIGRRKK
jgi:hypothetical protein